MWDPKFVEAALDARKYSTCAIRKVGAVIVRDGVIVAVGWSGVPRVERSLDCIDAGCPRCIGEAYKSGKGYDLCICAHAEQHAIALAAKEGIACQGASLFSSLRPCVQCLRAASTAGIANVYFVEDWKYEMPELEAIHDRIRSEFGSFSRVELPCNQV